MKNISNHVSSSNSLTLFNSNKRCTTPVIIKRNARKTCNNFLTKKPINQMLPKYLSMQKNPIQKQNLLHQIEKQNKKFKDQHSVNKKLQTMLEIKQSKCLKKTLYIKRNTDGFGGSIQGIDRNVTTSSQASLLVKKKQQNFIKSVNSQLRKLTQQRDKNCEAIQKIKQSKKYTRFLENQEQCRIFSSELINMKKDLRRAAVQIMRLKRIDKQGKCRRMQQLLMQGQIQDSVQGENIQIYHQIQSKNQQLKSTKTKKINLNKKKQSLLTQIQIIKQRHNLPQQVIQMYYQSIYGTNSRSRVVMHQTGDLRIIKTVYDEPNGLEVLKENLHEDDIQSSRNSSSRKQPLTYVNPGETRKNTFKQTAANTLKVHSNVRSENRDFVRYQYEDGFQKFDTENQKRKIEELQRKYFYEDENLDDEHDQDEQVKQECQKSYSDENLDEFDQQSSIQSNKQNKQSRAIQVNQSIAKPNRLQKFEFERNSRIISL